MGFRIRDAELVETVALPVLSDTVYTDPFDLGAGAQDFVADAELRIEAPALAVGELANGETVVYAVEHSADGVTYTTLMASVLTQTGADGAGAAAANAQVRLPVDVNRYVRVAAVASDYANDLSAKTLTVRLLT